MSNSLIGLMVATAMTPSPPFSELAERPQPVEQLIEQHSEVVAIAFRDLQEPLLSNPSPLRCVNAYYAAPATALVLHTVAMSDELTEARVSTAPRHLTDARRALKSEAWSETRARHDAVGQVCDQQLREVDGYEPAALSSTLLERITRPANGIFALSFAAQARMADEMDAYRKQGGELSMQACLTGERLINLTHNAASSLFSSAQTAQYGAQSQRFAHSLRAACPVLPLKPQPGAMAKL